MNKSPWEIAMDSFREDEDMRAGTDGTLFAKEQRLDAETQEQLDAGIKTTTDNDDAR